MADRWVERNGVLLGQLVGQEQDTIRLMDRYKGRDLNTRWADRVKNYRIKIKGRSQFSRWTHSPQCLSQKQNR